MYNHIIFIITNIINLTHQLLPSLGLQKARRSAAGEILHHKGPCNWGH